MLKIDGNYLLFVTVIKSTMKNRRKILRFLEKVKENLSFYLKQA